MITNNNKIIISEKKLKIKPFIPVPFTLMDNIEFRRFMKKRSFLTYMWLRRYVVRNYSIVGSKNYENINEIYEYFYKCKKELVASKSMKQLAKDLGIAKSTIQSQIIQLEADGILKIDFLPEDHSGNGQKSNVYILGTHNKDLKNLETYKINFKTPLIEHWFIDDVFANKNKEI